MVTLDERADEIIGDCIAYADGTTALRRALEQFRVEVENDALERVAERYRANQKLADEIRAMKHPATVQ